MVVNPEGEIAHLVSRTAWPDTAFIVELNERFPRVGFHLFQRGEYAPEDVRVTIANILEGIRSASSPSPLNFATLGAAVQNVLLLLLVAGAYDCAPIQDQPSAFAERVAKVKSVGFYPGAENLLPSPL